MGRAGEGTRKLGPNQGRVLGLRAGLGRGGGRESGRNIFRRSRRHSGSRSQGFPSDASTPPPAPAPWTRVRSASVASPSPRRSQGRAPSSGPTPRAQSCIWCDSPAEARVGAGPPRRSTAGAESRCRSPRTVVDGRARRGLAPVPGRYAPASPRPAARDPWPPPRPRTRPSSP